MEYAVFPIRVATGSATADKQGQQTVSQPSTGS